MVVRGIPVSASYWVKVNWGRRLKFKWAKFNRGRGGISKPLGPGYMAYSPVNSTNKVV